MIPTSIDGTDITGATIDGTDVQEITVDGNTVFTAGPPIVDDFESGSLAPYTSTSNYTISSTTVAKGSNSLEMNGGGTGPGNLFDMFSEPGDGLANYPVKGQKFSVFLYNTAIQENAFLFGVDGSDGSGYYVFHLAGANQVVLGRADNFTKDTRLFEINPSMSQNEWYEYEIQWHDGSGSEPDNTIELTVFDTDANNDRDTQITTNSIVDSTYASQQGVGFAATQANTCFVDEYIILGDVD